MILKGKPCPQCGKVKEAEVPFDQFVRWQNGELIQNVMPHLSNEDRETFITGYCGPCWDQLFAEDDDAE